MSSTNEHKDILISPASDGKTIGDSSFGAAPGEEPRYDANSAGAEDIAIRQTYVSFRYRQMISLLISLGLLGFAFSGIWPDFIALYPMRVIVVTATFFILSMIVFIFDFLFPLIIVATDRMKYYKIRRKYGYPLPACIRNFCLYVLGICALTTSVVNFGISIKDYPKLQQTISKTTQDLRDSVVSEKVDEEMRTTRYRTYDITYMHRLGLPVPREYQTNSGYMNTKGNFHYETRYHPRTWKIIQFLTSDKHQWVSNWGDFVIPVKNPELLNTVTNENR